jgi:uncharacterized protein with HEPN domain
LRDDKERLRDICEAIEKIEKYYLISFIDLARIFSSVLV